MVRTRSGEDTGAQFDFGALPDELQEHICGYVGRDAITLSEVCRATRCAKAHLVNGLLKLLERPNGAEGVLGGMDKMCRLRWVEVFQCCRDPRFRHPHYEWQRRLMHILINKLGGCRGAEAEGDVMAFFVALFATAADEDLLMERFIQGWVKIFRLYSMGTDALAVADDGIRSAAAFERAGVLEMSSASSEAFGALVALRLVDRNGGHGELMTAMDIVAQKLYPPQNLLAVRPGAVDITLVSHRSEPRSLLLGDGSAGARAIYDARLTLAAVRKKKGGIEKDVRLRAMLEAAREDEREKLLRETNAGCPHCLSLPDVIYWAKSMVQGFDVARFLNDPAYRDWIMARCRWGADGDSVELRGALQRLWPTTYDIASNQEFTRCVQRLEAATTEQEIVAARSDFEEFYEREDVVGYGGRCADWALVERIIREEDEADAFFLGEKGGFLGALRSASATDVFEAFILFGGARLRGKPLGVFKVDLTIADYPSTNRINCVTQLRRPFFELVGLAFCYGLTGGTTEIIDDGKGLLRIVCNSIYEFFTKPDKMLLGSTYPEMHIIGPDGRVHLGLVLPGPAHGLLAASTRRRLLWGSLSPWRRWQLLDAPRRSMPLPLLARAGRADRASANRAFHGWCGPRRRAIADASSDSSTGSMDAFVARFLLRFMFGFKVEPP